MKLKSEKRNWEGLLFLASSKRVSIMAKKEWAFEDLRKGQKRPLIWRGHHHLVMQQLMLLHPAILMALFLFVSWEKYNYKLKDYCRNDSNLWNVRLCKPEKKIVFLFCSLSVPPPPVHWSPWAPPPPPASPRAPCWPSFSVVSFSFPPGCRTRETRGPWNLLRQVLWEEQNPGCPESKSSSEWHILGGLEIRDIASAFR